MKMNGDRGCEAHTACYVRPVAKTDKSWRKKCRSHKNDAIAAITIDVSRRCICFAIQLDKV